MIEPRMTAVTIEQVASRPRAVALAQAAGVAKAATLGLTRVGVWAGETAQQFGVLVAVLMGPAVFSAYAFAAWALAANLGWADTFIFTSGALSSWIVWLGMAVVVNTAASILKKHTRSDQ